MTTKTDEQVLWHNEITKGFFHKHIVQIEQITNYNIVLDDVRISLLELDDIIIANKSSVGNGQYMGLASGRYARSMYGLSNHKSSVVGDIVFMQKGRAIMIWHGLHDPSGIVALAKAARKALVDRYKTTNKSNKTTNNKTYLDTNTTDKIDVEGLL